MIASGPNIITDDLILHWDAGNSQSVSGGTVLLDLSGLDNEMTVNGATFDTDFMTFDGINDYIDLPSDVGYNNEVTLMCWFKANGAPAGGYHILAGPTDLEVSINSSGELRTGVEVDGVRFVNDTSGFNLVDGDWYYVGVTYASGLKKSFINGVAEQTQSVTGSALDSTVANRRIGRFGTSGTYYLNGSATLYSIYSRALSDEEVLNNFDETKSRFGYGG